MGRRGEGFETSHAPNRNGSYEDHVMAQKALPSPEVLRQLLRYEPETGKLFWRPRPLHMFEDGGHTALHIFRRWNARYAGTEAFTAIGKSGYRHGCIGGRTIGAHRAAWAVQHGKWPNGEIDHINGRRTDNRMCNLRDANRYQNAQNSCMSSANKSGIRGVSFSNRERKWKAQITANKIGHRLGTFKCRTAAQVAYAVAANCLHGQYQRGVEK